MIVEKSHNAYMLFYDRMDEPGTASTNHPHQPIPTQVTETLKEYLEKDDDDDGEYKPKRARQHEANAIQRQLSTRISELRTSVLQQNAVFFRDALVFDNAYFHSIHELVSQAQRFGPEVIYDAFILGASFLFNTLAHSAHRDLHVKLNELLVASLSSDLALRQWMCGFLLESDGALLKTLLIDCIHEDIRVSVLSHLLSLLKLSSVDGELQVNNVRMIAFVLCSAMPERIHRWRHVRDLLTFIYFFVNIPSNILFLLESGAFASLIKFLILETNSEQMIDKYGPEIQEYPPYELFIHIIAKVVAELNNLPDKREMVIEILSAYPNLPTSDAEIVVLDATLEIPEIPKATFRPIFKLLKQSLNITSEYVNPFVSFDDLDTVALGDLEHNIFKGSDEKSLEFIELAIDQFTDSDSDYHDLLAQTIKGILFIPGETQLSRFGKFLSTTLSRNFLQTHYDVVSGIMSAIKLVCSEARFRSMLFDHIRERDGQWIFHLLTHLDSGVRGCTNSALSALMHAPPFTCSIHCIDDIHVISDDPPATVQWLFEMLTSKLSLTKTIAPLIGSQKYPSFRLEDYFHLLTRCCKYNTLTTRFAGCIPVLADVLTAAVSVDYENQSNRNKNLLG